MSKRNFRQELFFMKSPTNLRFLLALGNTKVVVLKDQDELQFYAKPAAKRTKGKTSVTPERLAEALLVR